MKSIEKDIWIEKIGKLKDIQPDTDSEEFYNETVHALVDVFPKQLDEEEAENISFEYEELHLRNEERIESFFKELYIENQDTGIYCTLNYRNMPIQTHQNILDGLDRLERHLWLSFIVKSDPSQASDFFYVESWEDLKLLMQLNTRELEFCVLHFPQSGISICVGFDLSMEIFFLEETQIPKMSEIVRKHDLFIR